MNSLRHQKLHSAPSFVFTVFAIIIAALCTQHLHAQIHAGRFTQFNDQLSDTSRFGFLSQFNAALCFNRAATKISPPIDETEEEELSEFPNRDRAWDIFFSENIDLYRWSTVGSLNFRAAQEVTANERNDISFNPRSASWEEEISVRGLMPFSSLYSSLSVFHRCKHDIDNSDEEQNDHIVVGHVQKRTLILSGLALTESLMPVSVGGPTSLWHLDAELRAEAYLIHHDYRYPVLTFGYSWEQARASVMGTAALHYSLSTLSELSLRAHFSEMFFAAGNNRPSAQGFISRAELQYSLHGKVADFTISIVNERLFDEVVRISADQTNTWSLGFGFCPQGNW